MSTTGKQVARNSLLRIGGYAIGAALHFVGIVVIGRYLGAEGFGYFAFILAFVGIFQLLADMGVRNIVIRNIAVHRETFRTHLGVARTLLWILSLFSMGCIVLIANLFHLTDEVRHATYLAGLAGLFTFYGLGYSAVLRAFEEMEWDILGFVLHKVLLLMLLWAVSGTTFGLRGVSTAMLLANAGLWLYFWGIVSLRHGRAKITLDLSAAWQLLVEAFPLGIAEILRRFKQHADKLLLAALGTPVAVGLFSAASKFLEAMTPFTVNLTLPLFPVFSKMARESPSKLFQAFEQSMKFLYVMGTPVAVLLFVFSEQVMVMFFGEGYREAATALQVLSPAALLLLPTSVYGYLFTAMGRQHLYTTCVAISLLTNVLLALLLIPVYGYVGAALGTLAGEAVLFSVGLLMLRQFTNNFANLRLLWRPLLAGLTMGVVCWLVNEMLVAAVYVGVASGLAAYIGLLLGLQTFTQRERALLADAFRIRLSSVPR
jgi:O-antigen/teichoic acid export membrane protein